MGVCLFIDLLGHVEDEPMKQALAELEQHAVKVKILRSLSNCPYMMLEYFCPGATRITAASAVCIVVALS